MCEDLSGKYSPELIDHARQSTSDAFKTAPKRAIQKTAVAAVDLIGNKIADIITKTSPQNNSEIFTNEEERYISPEKNSKLLMI